MQSSLLARPYGARHAEGEVMPEAVGSQWRQDEYRRSERRYEGRQELIAKAARICFARRGVAKTSIADITRETNITRELFYYYFPNKGCVVDAVIDEYVDDARAILEQYLDEAMNAHPEGLSGEDALVAAIAALRLWLTTGADDPHTMVNQLAETNQWPSVSHRAAGEAVSAMISAGLIPASAGEGLRVALVGVMTVLRYNPEAENEHLAGCILPLLG